MLPPARLPGYGRVYISAVILLGFCVVGRSVYQLYVNPLGYQWFLLAALTLISGSATVKLPSVPASISISEAFVFTAILLYGPAAGTLTVALDGLVISYWIAKRRPESYRALFNMAAPAISAWCAGELFFRTAHIPPLVQAPTTLSAILPALFVSALAYFSLNSWLITFAISAETQLPALSIWQDNFIWLSLNYFCGASVAALLVVYRPEVSLPYIGAIVPLLLVLYFTFKTSMGRVEDANKHVAKVNSLYLSTIETLAMAIDAKDQITHGHIRRVQKYAIGLARELGVRDESLIRAIEAAALLHDMGKLAIPEHILNKPGKLTGVEFEKMKVHATVGADILSAIDFPYPVVPIVRHHHENWNGTGYPAGLAGTEIPMGARILSVVDCFDALTSDRPYRPRLRTEDALQILMERRGTMYDALVVDTFVRVYSTISPDQLVAPPSNRGFHEIANSAQISSSLAPRIDVKLESGSKSIGLCDLARIAGAGNLNEAAVTVLGSLKRLLDFSQSIIFVHDPDTCELVAAHVDGNFNSSTRGLRIPLGQKLSGWVAANRQTIVNSDPALDLGDTVRELQPRPSSCLSTPIVFREQLVGVVTLYSAAVGGFTEDDAHILEAASQQVSGSLEYAVSFLRAVAATNPADAPDLSRFVHLAEASGVDRFPATSRASFLFLEVVRLDPSVRRNDDESSEHFRQRVLTRTRASLRTLDVLFREGPDCIAVLMEDTDAKKAYELARRIQSAVAGDGPERSGLGIRPHFLPAPDDGTSLSQLVTVARSRFGSALEDLERVRV